MVKDDCNSIAMERRNPLISSSEDDSSSSSDSEYCDSSSSSSSDTESDMDDSGSDAEVTKAAVVSTSDSLRGFDSTPTPKGQAPRYSRERRRNSPPLALKKPVPVPFCLKSELQDGDSSAQSKAQRPKRKTKKDSKGHVKRPMNAFMCWSSQERKEIQRKSPKMHNAEISKQLGMRWRSLSDAEKAPFYSMATRKKKEHLEQNPDYKYKPQKKIAKPAEPTASNARSGRLVKPEKTKPKPTARKVKPLAKKSCPPKKSFHLNLSNIGNRSPSAHFHVSASKPQCPPPPPPSELPVDVRTPESEGDDRLPIPSPVQAYTSTSVLTQPLSVLSSNAEIMAEGCKTPPITPTKDDNAVGAPNGLVEPTLFSYPPAAAAAAAAASASAASASAASASAAKDPSAQGCADTQDCLEPCSRIELCWDRDCDWDPHSYLPFEVREQFQGRKPMFMYALWSPVLEGHARASLQQ